MVQIPLDSIFQFCLKLNATRQSMEIWYHIWNLEQWKCFQKSYHSFLIKNFFSNCYVDFFQLIQFPIIFFDRKYLFWNWPLLEQNVDLTAKQNASHIHQTQLNTFPDNSHSGEVLNIIITDIRVCLLSFLWITDKLSIFKTVYFIMLIPIAYADLFWAHAVGINMILNTVFTKFVDF